AHRDRSRVRAPLGGGRVRPQRRPRVAGRGRRSPRSGGDAGRPRGALVMSNKIEEANWKFHWRLTESAGLKIYLADYKGKRVLWEGSLPYVTVDHQRETLDVERDPGEVHGPWWVPLGTRTLSGPVRVQSFRGGVELSASFAAGPYHYTQLW